MEGSPEKNPSLGEIFSFSGEATSVEEAVAQIASHFNIEIPLEADKSFCLSVQGYTGKSRFQIDWEQQRFTDLALGKLSPGAYKFTVSCVAGLL
jgi:hypothetical protein